MYYKNSIKKKQNKLDVITEKYQLYGVVRGHAELLKSQYKNILEASAWRTNVILFIIIKALQVKKQTHPWSGK